MQNEPSGSVTHWIDGLRRGDSVAAQQLWNRYFAQLVAVARARLGTLNRDASGEDVALSALKSVMLGLEHDRFPDLIDRNSLWPLLVTITARKSIDEMRRQLADKRTAGRTQSIDELRAIIGNEPSPEFAVEVADEMERLVTQFDDQTLRTIAMMKLESRTNDEIAEELSLSRRTVIRKLNRIRLEWGDEESSDAT